MGEISLACTITLDGEKVFFESRMENGGDDVVEELRYPQLGGITNWAGGVSAKMTYAGYLNLPDPVPLFRKFPTAGAGGEPACFALTYPGMMMPWQDIYDEETNTGLYLGYHDETYRYSAWEYVLHPTTSGNAEDSWIRGEEAGGEPSGMVFSHVRCPFLGKGESFCSGKFVLMAHEGDWHQSSLCYREWFLENFPFEKESHWLRKKTAWFTSIIYQPEDKIVADYNTYADWCADAANFGVNCYELIGWDKGGLERGYPEYEPARALGGREAFCEMVEKIHKIEGGRLLAFANYNVLDSSTDWFATELNQYVAKDANGHSANWMAWGEGTLSARCQLSVNRHYVASVVPRIQEILEDYLLKVAEDGVDGLQIDKLCVGSILDFNPAQMGKPDTANFEGLVSAIASLYEKAREINPDFCIAAECSQDRMIPYIDVYYRCAWGHMISPLRYVFPEWTACNHVAYPKDYYGVNGAVMTGAVLCIEPSPIKTPWHWIRGGLSPPTSA